MSVQHITSRFACKAGEGRVTSPNSEISYRLVDGDLTDIPKKGALIVVANSMPDYLAELIILHLVLRVRRDVRVLLEERKRNFLLLEKYGLKFTSSSNKSGRTSNAKKMLGASRFVKDGGVLIIFPAMPVSGFQFSGYRTSEPKWDAHLSRLVRITKAAVLPMQVRKHRGNILGFAVGMPRSSATADRQMQVWMGQPVDFVRLKRVGNDDEIARFLRLRARMLVTKKDQDGKSSMPFAGREEKTGLISATSKIKLISDIAGLPLEQKLASGSDMSVYWAKAEQIPAVFREISRLREITFRAAGEGTGFSSDADFHDAFYLHLFVWDHRKEQIAGAYRMGLSDEILKLQGKRGLYSQTLFKLSDRFLDRLSPALELGRSFVCEEYQRSIAPMLLLWKGIGGFLVRHPHYRTLFGPVSISNRYTPVSQQLMVEFFNVNSVDETLRKLVKPRTPFRGKIRPFWRTSDLSELGSLNGISELVSYAEEDGKGIPVLLRHYINIGGRFLGFNTDKQFGNCVDGLVVVDLDQCDDRVLDRYMGRCGAAGYRKFPHRQANKIEQVA